MRTMLRTLLVTLLLAVATLATAQDMLSVKDAAALHGATTEQAKTLLLQQGYTYQGITGYETKSHTWTKRVSLTRDFVPTQFQEGTSSIVSIDQQDGTLCLYVFNRTAFDALKAEARKQGYEADRKAEFFYKEDAPSLLFLEQPKPFPYLMQVSE